MTTQTLRPNQEGIDNHTYAATGSGGSLANATNDDSDATYISGLDASTVTLGFTTYTLAAGERCLRMRARLRAVGPLATVAPSWALGNFTDGKWTPDETTLVQAVTDIVGAWHSWWPSGPSNEGNVFSGGEINQAEIDKVQLKFHSTVAGGSTAHVLEEYIDLDIRHAPVVNVTGPSGTNPGNTHSPTATWTPTIGDGQAQTKFRIKVFNLATNAAPAFTDTSGLAWDSGAVASAATSRKIGAKLANGNYRVLIEVAKDFNGFDWWSTPDSSDFTVADSLPVPTNLTPTGTVNTGYPTLSAVIPTDAFGDLPFQRVVFQTAADSGFTNNVTTWDPLTLNAFNVSATTFAIPQLPVVLTQQGWWLRAQTVDSLGDQSAWSQPVQFTVSHPLQAFNEQPVGGDQRPAGTIRFSWDWLDSDVTDLQQSARIVVTDTDTNTQLVDTGILDTTDKFLSISGLTTLCNASWTLRLYNQFGVVSGPYGPFPFTIVDAPIVVITNPSSDPFADPSPLIQWTYTPQVVGDTMASWHVFILDPVTQLTVADSGLQSGAALSWQVPINLTNHARYEIHVQATGSVTGFRGVAVFVGTLVLPPPNPVTGLFSTIAQLPNAAINAGIDPFVPATIPYVQLFWDATGFGADFIAYHVYRFTVDSKGAITEGVDGSVELVVITSESSAFFNDVTCARDVDTGTESVYLVTVETVTGESAAVSASENVPAYHESDLLICSNESPEKAVLYQEEGRPETFKVGEAALAVTKRIYGGSKPMRFEALGQEGDIGTRTLILGVGPRGASDQRGRKLYDPLLAMLRDEITNSIAVADGSGRRIFAGVSFNTGTYRRSVGSYLATVDVTEVEGPTPVVADVPWFPIS